VSFRCLPPGPSYNVTESTPNTVILLTVAFDGFSKQYSKREVVEPPLAVSYGSDA
jgi:hypothetical protein